MATDRALFWKLAEIEHSRVRAFCRKLIGSRDDGDDLYHDVLVAALRCFDQLRDHDSFRPWLYRIAVNGYKSRVRRPWPTRLLSLNREIEDTLAGPDPDRIYAARRRLETGFRAITPDDRALVVLHEMEGWTVLELAQLFGRTPAAVKMRLSRARKRMRRAIETQRRREKATVGAAIDRSNHICVAVKPGEE